MTVTLEVCTGSYEDCLAAADGGAERVELNSALIVGGLTPTIAALRLVKQNTNLKVICMDRPREGGFIYTELEKHQMLVDAQILLQNGADGVSFGFLADDMRVDIAETRKMTDLIHSFNKTAVFHRAFDVISDQTEAIEALIQCKVDRILTSGGKETAEKGISALRDLIQGYGNKIEVLPGCGINSDNVVRIIRETGAQQVHSSCKKYVKDLSTCGHDVNYSCLAHPNEYCYQAVDPRKVNDLIDKVRSW